MKPVIINHQSGFCKDILRLFPNADIIDYKLFDSKWVDQYDFIILSGGPINISGEDDLVEEKEYLKQTSKPILGICLGMQILSIINGCELNHWSKENKRVGKINVSFNGKELSLHHEHYCYINQVPDGFNAHIREDIGIVDWIEHKEKKILAFQSHPEKSGLDGLYIRDYFLSKSFNSSTNL